MLSHPELSRMEMSTELSDDGTSSLLLVSGNGGKTELSVICVQQSYVHVSD